MATEATVDVSTPPDADWMRGRLEEVCSIERPSASPGERRAAEWLADQLRQAGARDVWIEEEPGANGTFWWSIGLLAGIATAAGLAARRGGRLSRALAAAVGGPAAALIADELPPGKRRFRRLLPNRTAHHVLAEMGPEDAERTIVVMGHHDAPRTAFFFNPVITETVGERAPWVFENTHSRLPVMWPPGAGPALVAAGGALGGRRVTGHEPALPAGRGVFRPHIGAGKGAPAAND